MRTSLIVIAALFFYLITLQTQGQATKKQIDTEIPHQSDGIPDLFYRLDAQKARQLKLDNIENGGYDSLQIRLWYEYSLLDVRKLIVLKYKKGKWHGSYYYIHADWKYQTSSDSVTRYTRTELKPKSGWENFSEAILAKGISTLPNLRDILEPNISFTDGAICNVEIATQTKYRYYSYMYATTLADKYWQAKKLYEVLALIDHEFNISFTHIL